MASMWIIDKSHYLLPITHITNYRLPITDGYWLMADGFNVEN